MRCDAPRDSSPALRAAARDEEPPQVPDDGSPVPETTNGDATPEDGDPALLTDSRLVCITDEKAPRLGLEPRT